MRAKLYRKGAAEPLCEVELEVRADDDGGALFEARLDEDAAHLAVDLAGGIVFATADGARCEGAVQHAFRPPRYGASIQGSLSRPEKPSNRHDGCRLFVSPTGRSGFALGAEGDRAGWLYDFFASPDEEIESVTSLLEIAMAQGARQLVTYEHPFVELLFLRAGFRTRVRVPRDRLKDPPADWIPDAAASGRCPDFLCMVRSDGVKVDPSSMASDLDGFASRPGTTAKDEHCAKCRAGLPQLHWLDILAGYLCRECRFLRVCGTLTLSPWDRADAISTRNRFTGPKRAEAMFTSGSDLLGR